MSRAVDLTGQRFGKLHVIRREGSDKSGKALWLCKCECGKQKAIPGVALRMSRNPVRSCGCGMNPRGPRKDLAGKTFGLLKVLHPVVPAEGGKTKWACRCSCGNQCEVSVDHLTTGHTRSCGCRKKSTALKHGHARSTGASGTYNSWRAMLQRCGNPSHPSWSHYGGRGVQVCERWDPAKGGSFENFLTDMGPRPEGKELDKDISAGTGCLLYSPETCQWATKDEQVHAMRNNRWVTHNGETLIASDWARRFDLHPDVFTKRIDAGWEIARALSTPVA